MSFTHDELEAFNTILEQKLAAHRRELELSLDQRMNMLKQELERYLVAIQQDLQHNLSSGLFYQENGLSTAGSSYPSHTIEDVKQEDTGIAEIQAEIAWEDLMDVIDNVVGNRLSALEESIQALARNTERSLLTQIRSLQNILLQGIPHYADTTNTSMSNGKDMLIHMEQLERIIESLQVAMSANHTLLSNRLYHHQHQPLERAHPVFSEEDGERGAEQL